MKAIMKKVYNFLFYLFGFTALGAIGVFFSYLICRVLWEGRLIR